MFTGDLDIIDHPALKVLIAYGPKFRCDTNADPFLFLAKVSTSLLILFALSFRALLVVISLLGSVNC